MNDSRKSFVTKTFVRKVIAAIAATASVGITWAAGATSIASAAPPVSYPTQYLADNCIGLSPNIIDIPYRGGVSIDQDTEQPGEVRVQWGNPSIWGYSTSGTLSWTNLRTGRSGVRKAGFYHAISGTTPWPTGYSANVTTGAGPVRFTTTARNASLVTDLTLPGPRCTGVANVR